jgi:protein-tyrosine-phosphatase
MSERVRNVLFLCTHNSARSVMAEALLNTIGVGRFQAFSAGSMPSGRVNPFALEMVKSIGYLTDNIRSKSWDEFAVVGAPAMDIVITVCDNAANEVCPFWPQQNGAPPVVAHWGFIDPSDASGGIEGKRQAFDHVFHAIRKEIERLVKLPIDDLTPAALTEHLQKIHQP